MDQPVRVTSELLWKAAGVAALIDVPLLWLVHRFVRAPLLARLKSRLAVAAALVFAAIWAVFGSVLYWDDVYRAVFPAWSRWLLPPAFGVLFGLLAVGLWHVAVRARDWAAVTFVILGSLVSLGGHGIGIARGLLDVPLLAGASAVSALTFGVLEFIVYWCLIVAAAAASLPATRERP